jgi:hypothetical protein
MDYGRTIKRAIEIVWRHKILWVFGVAAALFGASSHGGGGRGFNMLQYNINSGDIARWQRSMPFLPGAPLGPWGSRMSFDPGVIGPILVAIAAVAVVIGFALLIIGIIVRYTSLGALVGMVDEVEGKEKTTFRSGLHIGWRKFLRLFAVDLIIGTVMFGVVMVFMVFIGIGLLVAILPAVAMARAEGAMVAVGVIWGVGIGLVMLIVIIALAVVIGAVVTLVREYAFRAAVLDDQGVFASLGKGIALMRTHRRESVSMWLLLLVINLGLGLLAIPLGIAMGVGIAGPAALAFGLTKSAGVAVVISLPIVLGVILLAILVGGVYLCFRSAVWTLTYRELRGKGALAEA